MLTQELVKSLFDYKEGELRRRYKKNGNRSKPVSNRAGVGGYAVVYIKGKHYRKHRIVFLYHNGYLPEFIDHIDRDKLNNRIENLRPASRSENLRNSSKRSSTTSRFKGVHYESSIKKWRASIYINNKKTQLGCYALEIEAAKAYNKAATENFGEFANLNITT